MKHNRKTIELFSGTGSFSKIALENDMQIRTFDIASHAVELEKGTHSCSDILDRSIEYEKEPFILWASPPCTGFSVASIGKNWHKNTNEPKTDSARLGMEILHRTVELIREINPTWWFVENPRGKMRVKIESVFNKNGYSIDCGLLSGGMVRVHQHTVTYCQYGDSRMKPTDIWTNADWWNPKPPCKNGEPCHVSAPRGARTGTQGIKGNRLRSIIPPKLFVELFDQVKSNCVGDNA